MQNKKTRSYNSIVRQKQAEETKNRIAESAERLIKTNGYENTTIGAIAKEAGVATQTVYAVFGSKQGILMYILKRSMRDAKTDVNFKDIITNESLAGMAKKIASITTRYGQAQLSTLNSLGGFELIYPELHNLIQEASSDRRKAIESGVNDVLGSRRIELSPAKKKTLTDIVWAFTDNHLYYILVMEAGWPQAKYERLFQLIMEALLRDIAPGVLEAMDE